MVYCKLIGKENNLVTYAIGAVISDMTGRLVFDTAKKEYEIQKRPEKFPVYDMWLEKMLSKYRKEIKRV